MSGLPSCQLMDQLPGFRIDYPYLKSPVQNNIRYVVLGRHSSQHFIVRPPDIYRIQQGFIVRRAQLGPNHIQICLVTRYHQKDRTSVRRRGFFGQRFDQLTSLSKMGKGSLRVKLVGLLKADPPMNLLCYLKVSATLLSKNIQK